MQRYDFPLGYTQEPITRKSIQFSIIGAEHVPSNRSNLTVPLFGTSLCHKAGGGGGGGGGLHVLV